MSTATPPARALPAAPRSRFVTGLAWVMIVAAGAATPISLLSLLMVLAHSYGTSASDPLGFVNVVLGPPATLAAGVGLLRRRWWGHRLTSVLLGLTLLSNLISMVRSTAAPRTYVSPDGVPTTVLGAGPSYFLPVVVMCAALMWKLATPAVRAECRRAGQAVRDGA